MSKIDWAGRVTNEQVLARIRQKINLLKNQAKRRAQLRGHRLRHGRSLRNILEGEKRKKKKYIIIFSSDMEDMGYGTF